jgi:enoyl-CoA hydratase/carnithine racemase
MAQTAARADSGYTEILYGVEDGIATVTLNRPDKLNAWTAVIEAEMREAMHAAAADEAVKVIVLTGAGRGFCAGADMNLLQSIDPDDRSRETDHKTEQFDVAQRADFQTRYSYFPSIPKPIIAAVNGPCAGLGMVMALYCDMRFAARDTVFTTAFSRRGLIAEHGISWTLPHLVGPSRALDLLLSARKVGGEEAWQMGLVNQLFDDHDALLAGTYAYAKELAQMVSPRSMRVMKQQVYKAQFQTLAEAVATGNEEMLKSFTSEDFKEGVAHFVEKRAPNFTGR